jgi:hypothetical protein
VTLGTHDEVGLVDVQDPQDVAERDAVVQRALQAVEGQALAAHDPVRVRPGQDDRLDALLAQARHDLAHARASSLVPISNPS